MASPTLLFGVEAPAVIPISLTSRSSQYSVTISSVWPFSLCRMAFASGSMQDESEM